MIKIIECLKRINKGVSVRFHDDGSVTIYDAQSTPTLTLVHQTEDQIVDRLNKLFPPPRRMVQQVWKEVETRTPHCGEYYLFNGHILQAIEKYDGCVRPIMELHSTTDITQWSQ